MLKISNIFLFLLLQAQILCSLTYIYSFTFSRGNLPGKFYSHHSVNSNNFSSNLCLDSTYTLLFMTFDDFTFSPTYKANFHIPSLSSLYSSFSIQQRTAPYNSVNATNNTFLIFSTKTLKLFKNNFASYYFILNMTNPNQIITETFFITNSTKQFFVLMQNINSNYSYYYYNLSNLIYSYIGSIPSTSKFIKSVQNNNYIFLLFNTGIYIISQNQTIQQLNYIQFHINQTNNIIFSIDSKQNMLAYSINNIIIMLNIKNITKIQIIYEKIQKQLINDIVLQLPYLIILSNNTLIQFDLDLYKQISYNDIGFNSNLWRINIVGVIGQYIINFYREYPYLYQSYSVVQLDFMYQLGNDTVCLESYDVINNTICVKNLSYVFQNKNNVTNFTNNSVIIINVNNLLNQYGYSQSNKMQKTLSKILSFSNINLMPNVVKYLFMLFDDIWYYKFHRTTYPQSIQMFMQKVDILYMFRVNSWFFDYIEEFNNLQIVGEKSKMYNNFITQSDQNPDQIYFLNTASQVYINNWLGNLLFVLFTKALCFFFLFMKKHFKIFVKIYNWARLNSQWWSFLAMAIQGNLMVLTFDCCLQLLAPNFLDFTDKLNLLFCLLIFFIVISYSTILYPLIYRFVDRKSAKTILTYSFYNSRSFWFESYTFLLRTLCRAMIQALTFQHYSFQIGLLMLSNIIFAIITIIFRKQFCHQLVFILFFVYHLFFLALDLTFQLLNNFPQQMKHIDYQKLLCILIWCIIVAYLLLFLVLVIVAIYPIFQPKQINQCLTENQTIKTIRNIQQNSDKLQVIQKVIRQQENKSENQVNQIQQQMPQIIIKQPFQKLQSSQIDGETKKDQKIANTNQNRSNIQDLQCIFLPVQIFQQKQTNKQCKTQKILKQVKITNFQSSFYNKKSSRRINEKAIKPKRQLHITFKK